MQNRVFLDNEGRFYKSQCPDEDENGPQPKDPSHAYRPVITAEFLQALPDDGSPMFIVDIDAKIAIILGEKTNQIAQVSETVRETPDEIIIDE